MPAKKTAKKKAAKKSTDKGIGLFDHIKAVKGKYNPNYFKNLSDEDKKTWNNWMVFRALSYNHEFLPIVAELERICWRLPDEQVWLVLNEVFCNNPSFDRFIKGKIEDKYDVGLIETLCKHFEISPREVIQYILIYSSTENGKIELFDLLRKYGYDEKELKKIKL